MAMANSTISIILVILALSCNVGLAADPLPSDPRLLAETLGRSRLRSPPPPQLPPPPLVLPSFDHFMLAETWPSGFCKYLHHNGKQCIASLPINFTLHGLWPSNKGSELGGDCDPHKQHLFDWSKVYKVGEDQLKKDWPSLEMRHKSNPPVPRIDNLRFWGEQWVKHGTCSVSMLDQYEYFSLALKLYNGINLREMLRKESVIPRGTLVARQAIFDAIRKHIKCKPQIRCQEIQNQYYLYEIRLCLTASKDPKFIDCNTEFVGCSINPEVYF